MRALLDVNVLVALLDAGHLHHPHATQWLQANAQGGWASCPLTQNGCVRILSQPGYANPRSPALVADRLRLATTEATHAFWPDSVSLLDAECLRWDHVLSPRHITDVYLLALAVEHKGCLVTLDRGISVRAVPGATSRHLVTLG